MSNRIESTRLREELRDKMKQVQDGINDVKSTIVDMQGKLYQNDGSNGDHPTFNSVQRNVVDNLKIQELQIVEKFENIYSFPERLKMYESKAFSNSSKANLRKTQSDIQRIRLWLYDLLTTSDKISKYSPDVFQQ